MKPLHLIDQYYRPGTYDAYTFVFDEQDPRTGYYTMLALSEDGASFSQWTEGLYTPGAANEHLGQRVALYELGNAVLTAFCRRIADPEDGGTPTPISDPTAGTE
jgi:hypothetical protein